MTLTFKQIKISYLNTALDKTEIKTLQTYINLCKLVIKTLDENYRQFISSKNHKIITENHILGYKDAYKISNKGFSWILQNLEYMNPVNYKTDISYLGENYLPSKIFAEKYKKDFNTYENSTIIGFILSVSQTVKLILRKLKEQSKEIKTTSEDNYCLIKGYYLPYNEFKSFIYGEYESLLDEFKSISAKMDSLTKNYKSIMKCNAQELIQKPKYTDIFRTIPHYRNIFSAIIKWLDFGEFSFSSENYLLKIKTIDKLYEYFCLIKLLNNLKDTGFILDKAYSFQYELPPITQNYDNSIYDNDKDINNTFIFKKNMELIAVYYQPIIYSSPDKYDINGIELYRNDEKNNFRVPDFLIKYNRNDFFQTYYGILDAKYSTVNSIEKNLTLQKSIIKYIISISGINKVTSPMIFMWLLCGRPDSKNSQKNISWFKNNKNNRLLLLPTQDVTQ